MKYSELKIGDTFIIDGTIYIKVAPHTIDGEKCNALRIDMSAPAEFHAVIDDNTVVTKERRETP